MTIKSEVFVEYLYLTPHLSPQSILTVKFILPTDVVLADKFAADANTKVVSVENIPDGWMGLDNAVFSSLYALSLYLIIIIFLKMKNNHNNSL